ncbi:MAG: hypothetical protein QME40_02650 [bacterium]|nr:hypothetical protein [bacterium]
MLQKVFHLNEKGQAVLIMAIIGLILFSAVSLSLVFFLRARTKHEAHERLRQRAYYLAETGISYGLNEAQNRITPGMDLRNLNWRRTLPQVEIRTDTGETITGTIEVEIIGQ